MRPILFFFTGPLWARLVALFGVGWAVVAAMGSGEPPQGITWESGAGGIRVQQAIGEQLGQLSEAIAGQRTALLAGAVVVLMAALCFWIAGRLTLPRGSYDIKKHDAEMPAVTMLPESRAAAINRRDEVDGRRAAQGAAMRRLGIGALAVVACAVAVAAWLVPERAPHLGALAGLLVLPFAMPRVRAAASALVTRLTGVGALPPEDEPDPFDRILAERIRRSAPLSHRHRA